MEYYVYIILNPLKSGNFNYDNYHFEYEPFYVGKGKGKRKTNTLSEKKNKFKRSIIEKIKENQLQPIRIIIESNLNENDAFKLERKMITLIGRRDLKTGTLTNFTDGGEGTSGIIQSKKTKEKRNNSLLKYRSYFKSNDFKEKMKKIMNDKKSSPEYVEYCKNLSEKYKGSGNPRYGKKNGENQKEGVRKAHLEGKYKLTEIGKQKLVEAAHKRKGKKNNIKRCDSHKYILISPEQEEFIIFGAVSLQKFCKENKLQYHIIKNNFGVFTKETVTGNKLFAKNTIGWKRL